MSRPRHLHLDFETFSKVDLGDVGAYRYAFDPSTEILCAAMAFDDDEPLDWWHGMPQGTTHRLNPYWDALENPKVLIYAHNAMFEMAICQALLWKTWGIKCPELRRFRCTMSLARRAGLPAKLEKLAEVLGDIPQKDKRGSTLLRKFAVMQSAKKPTKKNPDGVPARRIMPSDDPEAFAQLVEYCRQDVRAEQGVLRKLSFFDEPINNANYSLDAVINARGVPVNLGALRNAQRLVEEETELVGGKFRELTGIAFTQRDELLRWVNRNGHTFDNLQAETVDTFLEQHEGDDKPDEVVQALRMKQSVAYVSIKKIRTMLDCAGPHDNRVRGMLNHHGTGPGRWTASLVQFQNMKRPTVKHTEDAYREIQAGINREWLEVSYGPVLEVLSSCIRHFVHDVDEIAGEENPMFDADYSAIQARVICWLAGQEDALVEYRLQDAAITAEEKIMRDRYRLMASIIYKLPVERTEKHPHRFIGKQTVLGCGFGMGKDKFRGTCEKMGYKNMPPGLEEIAVDAFRQKHGRIVAFWRELEKAAMQAIINKGEVFQAGKFIRFQTRNIEGIEFLLCRLPSGRKIAYPRPRLVPHKKFEGKKAIQYFANIKGVVWGHVDTWGGTLAENVTMGVEADIMFHGLHKAEAAGYEVMTCIHDQALAYHKPGQTPEEFVKLLTNLPEWAKGLPVAAEGGLVPFYRKD